MNPLVELIHQRITAGSAPGVRGDGAVLGLCIEGGAMRGVVSAGMVSAIERLGLLAAFDFVVGCSAGAANGAYLVAGRATLGSTIYYENINNRSFIDPKRLITRRPVVDLDFLVRDVMTRQKPLDGDAVVRSPVPLVVVAANVERGTREIFRDFRDGADVLDAIRATSTMPILAGGPFAYRGRRCWDGSIVEPIPIDTAAGLGCTHVLVLLTRPRGVGRPPLSLFERTLILPRIRRVSPPLAAEFSHQHEAYAQVMASIDSRDDGRLPHVFALRPAGPPISNLERRREVLVDGARQGAEAVLAAFEWAVHSST